MRKLLLRAVVFACVWWALGIPRVAARDLSFEQRVAAQEAIERVYHSHQKDETRAFENAVPRATLEAKVRKYMKESAALQTYWRRPITAEMLRAETARMSKGTRMPERLRELHAALGDDSFLIAECLARPALADRMVRRLFEDREPGSDFDAWWVRVEKTFDGASVKAVAPGGGFPDEEIAIRESCTPDDTWDSSTLRELPEGRFYHTAVWTGSVMVVWGGEGFSGWGRQGTNGSIRAGAKYDPATDTWTAISKTGAPEARRLHSALWTGSRMIVWGGVLESFPDEVNTNTGGIYDPLTDTWTATSLVNAPSVRHDHVAAWSGTQMLIWGGRTEVNDAPQWLGTGARYNPATNAWSPIANAGAPLKRSGAASAWTGSKLIVWSGEKTFQALQDGAVYDPALNSWTAMSTTNAPAGRIGGKAVWTGTWMVVWNGGYGARYDPVANSWTGMAGAGSPSAESDFTLLWTGTEMIVWGGWESGATNAGGRYNPVSDTWTPTSLVGVPPAASSHSAVWTGSEMIVWGGTTGSSKTLSTGGRYSPATNTWASTAVSSVPREAARDRVVWTGNLLLSWGAEGTGLRYDPATNSWSALSAIDAPTLGGGDSVVWTGSEMIVWCATSHSGGRYDPAADQWIPISNVNGPSDEGLAFWTGSEMIVWVGDEGERYNPQTDTWTIMSTNGAPQADRNFAGVWTGTQLIVWGGQQGVALQSGARYLPDFNGWLPIQSGPLKGRHSHSAIWTGTEMIVWGGFSDWDGLEWLNDGARYDPATSQWTAFTSSVGAPVGREHHSAVWTGDAMVVWGGEDGTRVLGDGGRYYPATDTWLPVSATNAPEPRALHQGEWANGNMVIWGQSGEGALYALGQSLDVDGDGSSPCAGDCNDLNAAMRPGGVEVCDSLDNDCNGLADDGVPPPSGSSGVTIGKDGGATLVYWSPLGAASVYDVVQGSLNTLAATAGDFTAATSGCVVASATIHASPVFWVTAPAPGQGLFVLVRGRNCSESPGTYDEGGPSQLGSRDAEIDAAAASCP